MYYVGVDYHKCYSVATVLDSDSVMQARRRLDNRFDDFRDFLRPYDKAEVEAVVEATRSWGIPVDILEQLADRVILANPGEVKLIAKARIKTDKVDSLTLARLLWMDWVPEAYLRPRANREHQLILRIRCFLVQLRTRVKNRIHDLIDRQDESVREMATGFSDLFGKKGMTWLRNLELGYPSGTLLDRLLAVFFQVLVDAVEVYWRSAFALGHAVDEAFENQPVGIGPAHVLADGHREVDRPVDLGRVGDDVGDHLL